MKIITILLIIFMVLTLGIIFYDVNNINMCYQTIEYRVHICNAGHFVLYHLSCLITGMLGLIYVFKQKQ